MTEDMNETGHSDQWSQWKLESMQGRKEMIDRAESLKVQKPKLEPKDVRVGDWVRVHRSKKGLETTFEGVVSEVHDVAFWIADAAYIMAREGWTIEDYKRPEDPRIKTVIGVISGRVSPSSADYTLAKRILAALDKEKS